MSVSTLILDSGLRNSHDWDWKKAGEQIYASHRRNHHSDLVSCVCRIWPTQSTDDDKWVSDRISAAPGTNEIWRRTVGLRRRHATRRDATWTVRRLVVKSSQAELHQKVAASASREISHFTTTEYSNATVPLQVLVSSWKWRERKRWRNKLAGFSMGCVKANSLSHSSKQLRMYAAVNEMWTKAIKPDSIVYKLATLRETTTRVMSNGFS